MRLCKDCKWIVMPSQEPDFIHRPFFGSPDDLGPYCSHPDTGIVDPVMGTVTRRKCKDLRVDQRNTLSMDPMPCGYEGKLWEAKESITPD